MNTQANKFVHLPLWIAGVAAALFSAIAIASLAASMRTSADSFNENFMSGPPPEASAAPAAVIPAQGDRDVRGRTRCRGCGVIESMREMDIQSEKTGDGLSGGSVAGSQGKMQRKPVRNYEITIRLQDGSMQVINDANPARWRPGERVIVIAGLE